MRWKLVGSVLAVGEFLLVIGVFWRLVILAPTAVILPIALVTPRVLPTILEVVIADPNVIEA
jgi:hypothetical protein